MRCEEFNQKTREYLDDLLPEASRRLFSAHYAECPRCKRYVLSLGTFVSDLRNMGDISLPELMAENLLVALEETGWSKMPRRSARSSMTWKITAVMLAFGLCFVLGKNIFKTGLSSAENKTTSIQTGKGPLALQGLSPTEKKPAVETFSRISENAGSKSRKHEVSLRPVHWHLLFSSQPELQNFTARMKASARSIAFDSDSFLVLSFDKKPLEKVLPEMMRLSKDPGKGPFAGGIVPDVEGEIKMSLWLETASPVKEADNLRHWHFYFRFPNKFSLLAEMKSSRVQFIFESPEIWVFEVPGSRLDSVYERLNNTHALITDFGKDGVAPVLNPEAIVRVFVYIEEG